MKCVDIRKGVIKLSDDLVIYPRYSFELFKNSKYFSGHNAIRQIILDGEFTFRNRRYKVVLCFSDGIIQLLELVCIDEEFTWETEPLRKVLHDQILTEWGLAEYNKFEWGEIYSNFDEKGGSSSILFNYQL